MEELPTKEPGTKQTEPKQTEPKQTEPKADEMLLVKTFSYSSVNNEEIDIGDCLFTISKSEWDSFSEFLKKEFKYTERALVYTNKSEKIYVDLIDLYTGAKIYDNPNKDVLDFISLNPVGPALNYLRKSIRVARNKKNPLKIFNEIILLFKLDILNRKHGITVDVGPYSLNKHEFYMLWRFPHSLGDVDGCNGYNICLLEKLEKENFWLYEYIMKSKSLSADVTFHGLELEITIPDDVCLWRPEIEVEIKEIPDVPKRDKPKEEEPQKQEKLDAKQRQEKLDVKPKSSAESSDMDKFFLESARAMFEEQKAEAAAALEDESSTEYSDEDETSQQTVYESTPPGDLVVLAMNPPSRYGLNSFPKPTSAPKIPVSIHGSCAYPLPDKKIDERWNFDFLEVGMKRQVALDEFMRFFGDTLDELSYKTYLTMFFMDRSQVHTREEPTGIAATIKDKHVGIKDRTNKLGAGCYYVLNSRYNTLADLAGDDLEVFKQISRTYKVSIHNWRNAPDDNYFCDVDMLDSCCYIADNGDSEDFGRCLNPEKITEYHQKRNEEFPDHKCQSSETPSDMSILTIVKIADLKAHIENRLPLDIFPK